MRDYMRPLTFEEHLNWILGEYGTRRSIYGIPEAMFYRPDPSSPMVSRLFGDFARPLHPYWRIVFFTLRCRSP